MGNRGSKSMIENYCSIVKEQRVDGSSDINEYICKVYSSRQETGSWMKLSKSRLKIPQVYLLCF